MHPHLYFKNYNISIYIDSSFQIKGDLNEFLLRILTPEYNIYNLEHPDRNKIFDEIFAVIVARKEKLSMVKIIWERYIKENFPDNIYLMNKWFEEIEKYSHRDQLSFNYLIWKK